MDMSTMICIDTMILEEIATSLGLLAEQLCSMNIPSADGIGGDFAGKLQTQKSRLHNLAGRAKAMSASVRKASGIYTQCEEQLLNTSQCIIEVNRNKIQGNLAGAIESGTLLLNILANPFAVFTSSIMRGRIDQAITGVSQALGIMKENTSDIAGFSSMMCEEQKKLALGIYNGFKSDDLVKGLNKKGYSTLTVDEPAGIIAYRIGEDRMPEIQIVLKGTNLHDVTDIFNDFAYQINAEGYHSGFSLASQSFLNAVSGEKIGGIYGSITYGDVLKAASEGSAVRINITGHSLGGAEAQITTAALLKSGIPAANITTFTFASPAVATEKAVQAAYLNGAHIYNIVNSNDVVPLLGAGGSANLAGTGNLGVTYSFKSEGISGIKDNHIQAYQNIPYGSLNINM